MSKIVLNNVVSVQNTSVINDNFQKIASELNNKALYRDNPDGEPNQMESPLDMNQERIYNLPVPVASHEPATKGFVEGKIAGGEYEKILRVSDTPFNPLPDASIRKNKLLAFDNDGVPIVDYPSPDSSTQLRMDLAAPTGGTLVSTSLGTVEEVITDLGSKINIAFPTYAALRAYAGTSTFAVVSGTGIAGNFVLNVSDLTTPDNGGTVIVGTGGRRWFRVIEDSRINVTWFGAKGDNVTDDYPAINNTITAATALNKSLYIPVGNYRTSATLTLPNTLGVITDPGTVFQRTDSSSKTFACFFTLPGNGVKKQFGVIDGYDAGIVMQGNLNVIEFKTISNCNRGFVVYANSANSLDNEVWGSQIGVCTQAIVFENYNRKVQQGNKIYVNFAAECNHTLTFNDFGTHSSQAPWDRNQVVLQASDPFFKSGATLFRNLTAFPVPALTYKIESWAGGWNRGDDTIRIIEGPVSDCYFEFNIANEFDETQLCSTSNRSGLDSCTVFIKNNTNIGSGSSFVAVDPANHASFNSGKALYQNRFRIQLPIKELVPGETVSYVFKHVLSQTNNGGRFQIVSREAAASSARYNLWIWDAGTETRGMVRFFIHNPTSTNIPASNLNIVVGAFK